MPSTYYPNATIPTVGVSATTPARPWMAILSSTNATPIVVTTVANHDLSTGDCVEVVGHLVNLSANGTWQIIVLSATTFSLQGSAGDGVGAQTGNVQTITVDPAFSLPNDGTDLVNASSVNQFAEGAANAIPWLYQRTGQYRLVTILEIDNSSSDPLLTAWGVGSPFTSITHYNTPTLIGNVWQNADFLNQGDFHNPPGLAPGDIVVIDLVTAFAMTDTGSSYQPFGFVFNPSLGISENGGSFVQHPESIATIPIILNASTDCYTPPVYMRAVLTVANTTPIGSYNVSIYGTLATSPGTGSVTTPFTCAPVGNYQSIIKHYRLNRAYG